MIVGRLLSLLSMFLSLTCLGSQSKLKEHNIKAIKKGRFGQQGR
jgi:hypothetical protein